MKPWRKGLLLILAVLMFSVTAYAFSGIGSEHWSSKLEKGEYTQPMDVGLATETDEMAADEEFSMTGEAVEDENAGTGEEPPQSVFVIVSEPQQIFVATPDEVVDAGEDTGETIIEEPVEEHTDEESVEEPVDIEITPGNGEIEGE